MADFVVENRDFRQILYILNTTSTTTSLPKHGDKMRSWLDEAYQEVSERIESCLAAAAYKKRLASDLWTSPGSVVLLAHYFSILGTHQKHLLAIPRTRESPVFHRNCHGPSH
jgi:hypothetical protein